MKYGYTGLSSIVTSPKEVLDRALTAYFHSDTALHGINIKTNSLRSDISDGGDIVGNIERSLTYIIGSYFTTFTLDVVDNGIDEFNQMIGLDISVVDDGDTITFDKVLDITNGQLKEIMDAGHL